MRDIWAFLLQTLTASGAAVLLLLIKQLFRDKLSPRWQFEVWGVLALVLVLPAGLWGHYALVNWPLAVEALKTLCTGRWDTITAVAAPIPLPPEAAPSSIWDWLFVVYAVGVAVFAVRYLTAYLRLRSLLKRQPACSGSREEEIAAIGAQWGLRSCRVVEVERLSTAFVCGVFRPILVLPAGKGQAEAEVDSKVILHELLHLKYHDAVWGILICVFRCIHWCNPLLWWCANQANNDLEALCDQRVLEHLEGEERREYGKLLLSLADSTYASVPGTTSIANGGRNIRQRIEAIARFQLYPAGMGLVSCCIIVVLAASLAVGSTSRRVFASSIPELSMASARTTWCTTPAGAVDAYAKSLYAGNVQYRAMCAPLEEQAALAELARSPQESQWPWHAVQDRIDRSQEYRMLNFKKADGDVWTGTLVIPLLRPPAGTQWSGTVQERWMLIQDLQVSREVNCRWVVRALGDLQSVPGDARDGGNLTLPATEYAADVDSFTLWVRWQSSSFAYDAAGESTGTLSEPVPDCRFETRHEYLALLESHWEDGADPAENVSRVGISGIPLWGSLDRPVSLQKPNANEQGGSSDGTFWGTRTLSADVDLKAHEEIGTAGFYFLAGGSAGSPDGTAPDAFALDFYLNGAKEAELTLLPVEEGGMMQYDSAF